MKSKMSKKWILFTALFMVALSVLKANPNHLSKSKTETKMKDEKESIEAKEIHSEDAGNVALIDKLFIPAGSIDELLSQTKTVGKFIKTLPGLISQQAFESRDEQGNMTLITIAIWENKEALSKAKDAVQGEFQRLNIQPQEFIKRLNIKMERSIYNTLDN
ncbi:antibiotic biosynthesis monooxygenase family protein [Deminuibacter soli]|nr:hypothetical protein [Deminuibacter soli]